MSVTTVGVNLKMFTESSCNHAQRIPTGGSVAILENMKSPGHCPAKTPQDSEPIRETQVPIPEIEVRVEKGVVGN